MNLLQTITNTLSSINETIQDALCSAGERICDFFDEEASVSRRTIATICVISALTGIVYGFLISPVKKGIHVNVTNNCGKPADEDED